MTLAVGVLGWVLAVSVIIFGMRRSNRIGIQIGLLRSADKCLRTARLLPVGDRRRSLLVAVAKHIEDAERTKELRP